MCRSLSLSKCQTYRSDHPFREIAGTTSGRQLCFAASNVDQNDIVQLRLGIIGNRLICFQTRSFVSYVTL